jgi:hypothetical protein
MTMTIVLVSEDAMKTSKSFDVNWQKYLSSSDLKKSLQREDVLAL